MLIQIVLDKVSRLLISNKISYTIKESLVKCALNIENLKKKDIVYINFLIDDVENTHLEILDVIE